MATALPLQLEGPIMSKTLLIAACGVLLLTACEQKRAVVAASSPQTPQPSRNFMLFFAYDQATLGPDNEAVVREAAAAARARSNARVTVAGHADTAATHPTTRFSPSAARRRPGTRWCATASARPRSRSWPAARRNCWCRPPTACASQRTAASRSWFNEIFAGTAHSVALMLFRTASLRLASWSSSETLALQMSMSATEWRGPSHERLI